MALTIVPQLWQGFVAEAIVARNNVMNYGMVEIDTNAIIQKGDNVLRIPKLTPIDASVSADIMTSSSDLTPVALTDYAEYGVVLRHEKAWTSNEFFALERGTDLLNLVGPQIANYVLDDIQQYLAAAVQGAFTTTLLSTHVSDATGATITFSAIADAALKMGEKMESLTGIIMNSKVFNDAKQDGLVNYSTVGQLVNGIITQGTIPMIHGMKVWINDTMCAAINGQYPTYLLGQQPLYVGYQKTLTIDINDRKLVGGGTRDIIARWAYCPTVKGVSYTGTDMNATAAQLKTGTNWTKKAQNTNIKLVQLLTL